MKISRNYGLRTLTCQLTVVKNVTVSDRINKDYLDESILYAVCRFISHHQDLFKIYIAESYNKRFEKGKQRKPRTYTLNVPASRLELNGNNCIITFAVSADGIEISRVKIE